MSDEPRLGDLGNAQRYSDAEVARIARAAAPFVRGPKDAGKVYCPFCKLREARWKRHEETETASAGAIRLFIYCTQCHKTGVAKLDWAAIRDREIARRRLAWVVVLALLGVATVLWWGVA